jgi:HD-like signal output (HDOD) protein
MLKKLFGENGSTRSQPNTPTATPTPEPPAKTGYHSRILLCAPDTARTLLHGSRRFDYVPCNKANRVYLETVNLNHIDGALIHFDPATENVTEVIELATSIFASIPCCIFCNEAHHASITKEAWRFIFVSDSPSSNEIEEKFAAWLLLFPALRKETLRSNLSKLKRIPAEAANHQRIVKELQNPDFNMDDVVFIIRQDPGLTAQLLKLVNSAAFRRGTGVQSVCEAVSILGAARLQALIASAWAFFLIDERACAGFSPQREWAHAVKIAEKVVALCAGHQLTGAFAETAIVSAMLHDLGKILLAANIPQTYHSILSTATATRRTLWEVEDEMLGFNHAEVGGCVLAEWGVPLPIVEAIFLHHTPMHFADSPVAFIQQAQQDDAHTNIFWQNDTRPLTENPQPVN